MPTRRRRRALPAAALALGLGCASAMVGAAPAYAAPADPRIVGFVWGNNDFPRAWDQNGDSTFSPGDLETGVSSVLPIRSYSDATYVNASGLIYDFARDADGRDLVSAKWQDPTTAEQLYPLYYDTGWVQGGSQTNFEGWQRPYLVDVPCQAPEGAPFNPTNGAAQSPSAAELQAITNVLKLGYSEQPNAMGMTDGVNQSGSAAYWLSNVDGYLVTQYSLIKSLNSSRNLGAEGYQWTSVSERSDGTGRQSAWMQRRSQLLESWKNDDLSIKLVPVGDPQVDGSTWAQRYKLSVPVQTQVPNLDGNGNELDSTGGEQLVYATADLRLDTAVAGATITTYPTKYDYGFPRVWTPYEQQSPQDAAANPSTTSPVGPSTAVSVKQGDEFTLTLPLEGLGQVDANVVQLLAAGGSPQNDVSLESYTIPSYAPSRAIECGPREVYFVRIGERVRSQEAASAPIPLRTMTVRYVDEAGRDIAAPRQVRGVPGAAYSVNAETFAGYTLASSPSTVDGSFGAEDGEIVFRYSAAATEPSAPTTSAPTPSPTPSAAAPSGVAGPSTPAPRGALATTGTSLGVPLTVGVSAIVIGCAILFAIRRRLS